MDEFDDACSDPSEVIMAGNSVKSRGRSLYMTGSSRSPHEVPLPSISDESSVRNYVAADQQEHGGRISNVVVFVMLVAVFITLLLK